jgi:hypothetical protein
MFRVFPVAWRDNFGRLGNATCTMVWTSRKGLVGFKRYVYSGLMTFGWPGQALTLHL